MSSIIEDLKREKPEPSLILTSDSETLTDLKAIESKLKRIMEQTQPVNITSLQLSLDTILENQTIINNLLTKIVSTLQSRASMMDKLDQKELELMDTLMKKMKK